MFQSPDSGAAALRRMAVIVSVVLALFFAAFGGPGMASSAPSSAGERILSFDVVGTFEPTGVMQITETITVRSAGRDIKRGIYRTLPLVWDRADNKRFMITYAVKDVIRDGKPEPYSVSTKNRETTIRIGSSKQRLPPGTHRYAITYEVSNHFSRFPDWDELYWNVTGNYWNFPIDKVAFHLLMRDAPGAVPYPMPVKSVDVYTGKLDEKGKDARILADLSVVSTRPLPRGAGLTVAYTWPSGVLSEAPDPVEYSPLKRALIPSPGTAVYWGVPILIAAWFVYQRRRLGGGTAMPEVIPLFKVPDGLSPGAVRYIIKKRYDGDSFAGDLLRLVTKGAVSLEKNDAAQTVLRRGGEGEYADVPLERQEKNALDALFNDGASLTMSKGNNARIHSARQKLETRSAAEEKMLFQPVVKAAIPGLLLLGLLPVLCAMLFSGESAFISTFLLLFFCVFSGVILYVFRMVSGQVTGVLSLLARLPILLFMASSVLALGALMSWFVPRVILVLPMPEGYAGALLASMVFCVVGCVMLPGRTQAGLDRLAVAKGLRMYLGTAEENRFEALYPPVDSVQRFEELLPYALVLGVGKTWANRFARYLAATEQLAHTLGHASAWSDIRSFRFSSASSSAPPRSLVGGGGGRGGGFSGSGSSGGGSSGRGGGGGGGGGW